MQSQSQQQLLSLIKGQMFEGYLLIKGSELRASANGSKYLDLTLSDVSGDVNGKMWDVAISAPKVGSVAKIRGMMQEYKDRPQLRIDKLRMVDNEDSVDMSMLVRVAPRKSEDMYREIVDRVDRIQDDELKSVVRLRLEEAGARIIYFPAAQKLHHAERGGLLHHMSTMLKTAEAICGIYPTLDADLLAAGVVLHDLCKLTELNANEMGVVEEYTREGMLLGHLVTGVHHILSACERLNVREELQDLLAHMILAHHDLPEYGSPRRPMFPEAEVLHVVDLLDARIYEMNNALNGVSPGGYTEKIWSLERKLYRREKQ